MIPVEDLKVGDRIHAQADLYTIEILENRGMRADLWGRPMHRFWAKIIDGPQRVGDTGEVTYGPGCELMEPGEYEW